MVFNMYTYNKVTFKIKNIQFFNKTRTENVKAKIQLFLNKRLKQKITFFVFVNTNEKQIFNSLFFYVIQ